MTGDGAKLEPIQRLPLKEQAERQLLALIENGTLKPGDRLPSERELSEQLRVSRGTVRAAIQFLAALGMLEVHHGSGTVVSSRNRAELQGEWREWTARHAGRIRELLEVRRGLDAFAAELASASPLKGALATMEATIGRMREADDEDDPTTAVQADLQFHEAIGEATGNAALVGLIDSIGEELVQERAAVWSSSARRKRSIEEHTLIYEAIRAGDAAAARAAALAHLESVERDIAALTATQEEQK
ncbi:MAG: FadR family transcriptional regulator [Actinobacteria bacterium]|nr:FadR family transcriptional regulator [Actinomycetota bacterium]